MASSGGTPAACVPVQAIAIVSCSGDPLAQAALSKLPGTVMVEAKRAAEPSVAVHVFSVLVLLSLVIGLDNLLSSTWKYADMSSFLGAIG
ncbi:MAG TPA: hypothetical protein VMF65_06065 [Acidimicrobiales bacterium]|nr:hypothetical protein [Acidimicrobiales bacterium]